LPAALGDRLFQAETDRFMAICRQRAAIGLQYTRNMATGASTCDLAILLMDARKGVLDQTRRHSFISTLLGIKHLVVAVNKMDLVDYSEETFNRIREEYLTFAEQLPGNLDIRFVPLSALEGDNVASQSANMPWYSGPTLLEVLETVEIQRVVDTQPMRFPVQYVNRPNLDFRGFSGTIASGSVKVGSRVKALPSGVESAIARIVTFDGDLQEAGAGEAVTLVLKDEIDISRGDLLVDAGESVPAVQSAAIDVVWMAEQPLAQGQSYDIKIAECRECKTATPGCETQPPPLAPAAPAPDVCPGSQDAAARCIVSVRRSPARSRRRQSVQRVNGWVDTQRRDLTAQYHGCI
jgi:sulfate adenylyltransferase large subunit